MVSLILLSTQAPSPLADNLMRAGYRVFEALAVSEVLHLCEHHEIDAIIVTADVDDPEVVELRMRRTTIQLEEETTVKDIVWELSMLFPQASSTIQ